MRMVLMAVMLLLSVARAGWAQTSPSCPQIPNLACANGTVPPGALAQDIVTQWTFEGTNPFLLDGPTADDGFEVIPTVGTVAADRTLFIPGDANSAVPSTICVGGAACTAGALPCAAGNHISTFNVATGQFTCSADAGGSSVTWDAILDPVTFQTINMTTFNTTFTWTTLAGAADAFLIQDTTGNTGTGDLVEITTVSGSTTMKPLRVTAQGAVNGMEMSSAGVLGAVGTGDVQGSDLNCALGASSAACVDSGDIGANQVLGTHIAIGTTLGDILRYDGTDWVRLGVGTNTQFLGSTGTDLIWEALGPGTLSGALVWNEQLGGTYPSKTFASGASVPRTNDTLLIENNALSYRRVTSCAGGVNEFSYTSGTTVTMCGATDPGGVFFATYER